MTIISTAGGGAVAVMLAGALLIQGCSSSDQTQTAQGTRLIGSSGLSTADLNSAPYSSADWDAALNAAMTSDNGGE